MSDVKYASGYAAFVKEVPRRGMLGLAPGQGPDGYGKQISTDWMVQFEGEATQYRVYAVCFSNAASYYIKRKGDKLFLRSHELEAALDEAKTRSHQGG